MIELPLILMSGLLGSSHCVGMCGPFAISIGSFTTSWSTNLQRQLAYSAGRIFTYSVLGVGAGYVGIRAVTLSGQWVYVPAALAVLAGLLLIHQGLVAAGWFTSRATTNSGVCLGGKLLRTFLTRQRSVDIFVAGLLTGFLPCGLVYAFLAMAASTASLSMGALTMATFGIGTVPLMVATGCSASLLNVAARQRLLTIAGWCVVLAGSVSVTRGLWFFVQAWQGQPYDCPLC